MTGTIRFVVFMAEIWLVWRALQRFGRASSAGLENEIEGLILCWTDSRSSTNVGRESRANADKREQDSNSIEFGEVLLVVFGVGVASWPPSMLSSDWFCASSRIASATRNPPYVQ